MTKKSFLLAIVLSILLRFTDSDYPFGIFQTLLSEYHNTYLEGDRDNTVWGGDKACKSSGPTPPSALIILNNLLSFPAILQE